LIFVKAQKVASNKYVVMNGRRTINVISAIVENPVLVLIQNSVKGILEIAVLSLDHSRAQQIPLEL
jgi:hypothetical protein